MNARFHTEVAAALVVAAALAVGGCGRPELSGFLEPYTGFHEISKINPNLEYVQPGVNWGAYRKVRIAKVLAYVHPTAGYRPVDPDDLKRLVGEFQADLVESLGRLFEVTREPGPDVLDVRAAVTRLRPTSLAGNAAVWIVPGSMAVTAGYQALTNSSLALGEAGIELELVDSLTGVRRYGFVALHLGSSLELEQMARWGIAEKALKGWAELLEERLKFLRTHPGSSPQGVKIAICAVGLLTHRAEIRDFGLAAPGRAAGQETRRANRGRRSLTATKQCRGVAPAYRKEDEL